MALFKVRSVNLAEIANAFTGKAQTASHYKRLQRFLDGFGPGRIQALPADRAFVGEDWFRWLQAQQIPFHIRLKENTLIPNARNHPIPAKVLFRPLAAGQFRHLEGRRPIWGCFM